MSDYFDFIAKPSIAWLTVNRDCNFSCPWCYGQCSSLTGRPDVMSYDLCEHLLSIIHELGISKVILIGGEPTIYYDLFRIVNRCKELGLKSTIVTNCYRFSDDIFWDRYTSSPCDAVSISIKSVEQERFHTLGKGISLDKSLIGIKRAIDFHHSGVNTVFNRDIGKHGLIKIAETAKELGAKSFSFSPCSGFMNDHSFDEGGTYELSEYVDEICEVYPLLESIWRDKLHFSMRLPLCIFPRDFIEMLRVKHDVPFTCQVHQRTGVVFDTNGDVVLCNSLYESTIASYGADFSNAIQLMGRLNADKTKDNFKQLLRYPSLECSDCSWNTICRGGCLMGWLENNPSICRAVK